MSNGLLPTIIQTVSPTVAELADYKLNQSHSGKMIIVPASGANNLLITLPSVLLGERCQYKIYFSGTLNTGECKITAPAAILNGYIISQSGAAGANVVPILSHTTITAAATLITPGSFLDIICTSGRYLVTGSSTLLAAMTSA